MACAPSSDRHGEPTAHEAETEWQPCRIPIDVLPMFLHLQPSPPVQSASSDCQIEVLLESLMPESSTEMQTSEVSRNSCCNTVEHVRAPSISTSAAALKKGLAPIPEHDATEEELAPVDNLYEHGVAPRPV